MSSQVTHDQDAATHAATEGGRACPLPVDLVPPRGAGWARRHRAIASTGVITADVLGRTFS